MIKNTGGQSIGAQMISATDGSAFTGAVTVYVTGDAGTQAAGSVGSGACTHEGNGYHTYAPAQAETNYNLIAFTFTGSGAIPATVQVQTVGGDVYAALTAGVTLADDAITAAKFDESTAFPLAAADTGATAVARTGADSDTLESLSDQLDLIDAGVGSIGSGTGAALNFAATGDNTAAPLLGVTFVGSQVGTFAATAAEDGSYHQITDSGGATDIDIVYAINIGPGRNAAKVTWKGYVTNADTVLVQAYNGTTWDTRASITGTASTVNVTRDITLLATHTGTGASAGLVYIRFTCTGQSAIVVRTDEMLVAGVNIGQTVGYADGAVWVDTTNGSAGTTPFVNGVADNPALTWADAQTIAAGLGLNRYHLISGSSITLTASAAGITLRGDGLWTLALGGRDISAAFIERATVTGSAIGSNAVFAECVITDDVSTGPAFFDRCGFSCSENHPFVAALPGQYLLADCMSMVPGSGTPYFTYAGTGGVTGVNVRRWSGGNHLTLDANVTATIEVVTGGGQTVVCNGGDVEIRGICRAVTLQGVTATTKAQLAAVTGPISIAGADGEVNIYGVCGVVTDNRTGTPTLSNKAISQASINAEVDTALADYDGPTNTEMEARTLAAADYFDPSTDPVANVTLVATTTLLTTLPPLDLTPVTLAIEALNDFDPAADVVAHVSLVDVTTAVTIPAPVDLTPVMEAIGLLNDFDPALDPVANVTLVATTTTLTNAPNVPSAGDIADAVWDEAVSDHDQFGSTGLALAAAGTAGDPWIAPLPGDYAEGSAGYLLNDLHERLEDQVEEGPAVVVPAPAAGQTTAWAMCYDEDGLPEQDVEIFIQCVGATGTAAVFDGSKVTLTSDANGLAAGPIPRNASLTFTARRGARGKRVTFTGADADSLALPALVGAP